MLPSFSRSTRVEAWNSSETLVSSGPSAYLALARRGPAAGHQSSESCWRYSRSPSELRRRSASARSARSRVRSARSADARAASATKSTASRSAIARRSAASSALRARAERDEGAAPADRRSPAARSSRCPAPRDVRSLKEDQRDELPLSIARAERLHELGDRVGGVAVDEGLPQRPDLRRQPHLAWGAMWFRTQGETLSAPGGSGVAGAGARRRAR